MSFIKENIFIIMGVCLPLILVGLLALLQFASKASIEPPQYKVAYIVNDRSYDMKVSSEIDKKTKHLKISAKVSNNFGNYNARNGDVTLYIYKEDTGLETYNLDISKVSEENKDKKVVIPTPEEIKDTKFISDKTSPDGYKHEHSVYRNGNLMTEIFGYNRHRRKDAIVKKGVKVFLPETSRWPQTDFVGWVEQ